MAARGDRVIIRTPARTGQGRLEAGPVSPAGVAHVARIDQAHLVFPSAATSWAVSIANLRARATSGLSIRAGPIRTKVPGLSRSYNHLGLPSRSVIADAETNRGRTSSTIRSAPRSGEPSVTCTTSPGKIAGLALDFGNRRYSSVGRQGQRPSRTHSVPSGIRKGKRSLRLLGVPLAFSTCGA